VSAHNRHGYAGAKRKCYRDHERTLVPAASDGIIRNRAGKHHDGERRVTPSVLFGDD